MIILLLLSLVLIPWGFVLTLMGMWERKPDAPSVASASPKHWFVPFWKQRSWFENSRAYRKYVWGTLLWSTGFLLNALYFLMN